MRRSRSPASSYCSASGRDNSDWDVWAFKVKLRLRSGTPYLALEVSAAQKGSAFARDGYLHQSQRIYPKAVGRDGTTVESPIFFNFDALAGPLPQPHNRVRNRGLGP